MVTAASQIETSEPLLLSPSDLREAITELQEYHAIYAPLFTRREQREWAELYLRGLVSPDIGRKSIEPMILAIKGVDGNTIRAVQQFTGAGGWDDGIILKRHWQEVQVTLGEDDGVLVTDGSDFRKQGIESVGVKRQYCGELGKRANCQAGVFLGYVSSKGYTLLDRRLYLPEEWITGPEYAERRKKCGIPKDIDFQTKNELAWNMIESVHREGTLRCRWATFDEAFGRDTAFLDRIAGIKLWYLAEVPKDTQVWMDRPRTEIPAWKGRGPKPQRPIIVEGQPPARTVTEIAESLPPGLWIRHLIKEGSKGPMMADFVSLRVVGMRDSLPGPDVWLVLRRSLATGEIKFISATPLLILRSPHWYGSAACAGPLRPASRRGSNTLAWETTKSERGKDGITTWPFVFWLIISWCGSSISIKKTPVLTLPQTILLLSVVLPRPDFDLNWVIDVITYRQERNLAAYQSHRRSRLERLCPEAATNDPGNTNLSL
jgi:hypothetical protein